MTTRVLRIELRRSAASWAALLTLLVGLGVLFLLSGPWGKGTFAWDEQWTSNAWWQRHLLPFLWPLAVGAGALHGLRDRRSGTGELFATTPRPALHRTGVSTGATALALALAYLAMFAPGSIAILSNDRWAHASWVPVLLVGALALSAGAVLGVGVGRTFPSPLTPPTLAVAALVGCVLASVTGDDAAHASGALPHRVSLLFPALPQVPDSFTTIAARTSAGQAVWLVGLALTGLLLAAATQRRDRLVALVPAVLAVGIALPLLPPDAARTYVQDPQAVAPVCKGEVCVSRVHSNQLGTLAGPSQEALKLLAAKLPEQQGTSGRRVVPDRVREYTGEWPPATAAQRKPEVLQLSYETLEFEGVEGKELTRSLLAGAGTPPCPDGPNDVEGGTDRDMTARVAAAGWFLGEVKPLPGTFANDAEVLPAARDLVRKLHALPAAEQRERITSFRSASLSCKGDLLNTLNGRGAR